MGTEHSALYPCISTIILGTELNALILEEADSARGFIICKLVQIPLELADWGQSLSYQIGAKVWIIEGSSWGQ